MIDEEWNCPPHAMQPTSLYAPPLIIFGPLNALIPFHFLNGWCSQTSPSCLILIFMPNGYNQASVVNYHKYPFLEKILHMAEGSNIYYFIMGPF